MKNSFPRLTPCNEDIIPFKDDDFTTLQITDESLQVREMDTFADDGNPLAGSIWGKYGGYSSIPSFSYTPAKPKPRPRRARAWRNHAYWFIGDVHGNFKEYRKLLKGIREVDQNAITVQVGDLELDDPKQLDFLGPKDFFIQGNHDSPEACRKHPNFLGDFGYKHGIFFISGASSHGWGHELTNKQLNEAIELYEETKPEIVVTHDCPAVIREELFYKKDETRTTNAFQEMWNIHAPHVWAFGHHHWTQQELVDGTDFLCVGTLVARQMKLAWTTGYSNRETPSTPVQSSTGKAIGRFLTSWFPTFGKGWKAPEKKKNGSKLKLAK